MKIPTKPFSLFLVLVLLGMMPLTLYAEGTGSSAATVTATVIANNSPVYSVAVPTGIYADDLQRTAESSPKDIPFTIHISEILTLNDRQICVLVSGSDDAFVLKNEDGTSMLPYKVYSKAKEDESIEPGGIFATFTEIGKQDGFVRIDQKDIQKADTYTGNLRFSFTLMDIEE